MSETDEEFIARMEKWSEQGSDADRLFALARRGAEAADQIEKLRAALREIVDLGGAHGSAAYAERADKIARAALGGGDEP